MSNLNKYLEVYQEELKETDHHFPLKAEYAEPHPYIHVTLGDDGMETRSSFEGNKRACMQYHSKRIELYLKHTNRG
jgi:hypothetical protein